MSRPKRRKERFSAYNVFVAISVVDGCDQGLGVITNVSESGVCVRTPIPPPQYCRVILRISMDESHHEVQAMVRRVTPIEDSMFDVGLQLTLNDPGKEPFMRAFMDRVAETPQS